MERGTKMKLRWTWMILLMLALAAFWGCSDDDDGPADPPTAATPFETLAAAGAVYVNDSTDCPGVLAADVLQANLEDYTVIDIRSEADYLAGHIPGAFHSTLQTLVADLPNIPTAKPYVVACYSGQSAGFAKFAMEMLGYEDVKSLKFGMSSWSSALATGTWNNPTNVGNHLATPETTNNNADLVAHTVPDLGTYTNGTVVSARVGELLAGGFKSKTWAAVQDNLDDYFILNYWSEPDYSTLGHIPGAYQFTPYTSLGIDQMLDNLPTDKPILVYCWTGQHSSQVTAYLRCLGYDAWSFQYGANCLMHDALPASNQWTVASTHDYSVQPGWEPTADFAALAEAGIAYINDTTDFAGIISAQALLRQPGRLHGHRRPQRDGLRRRPHRRARTTRPSPRLLTDVGHHHPDHQALRRRLLQRPVGGLREVRPRDDGLRGHQVARLRHVLLEQHARRRRPGTTRRTSPTT